VLLVSIAVTGTVAYLLTHTEAVTNTFTLAEVPISVVEDEFLGETKKNVCVQNEGDVDAYIRAKIIVNWVDGEGKIYSIAPQPGDYTMTMGTGWKENQTDGFWYYTSRVKPLSASPDNVTGALISSCSPNINNTTGKTPSQPDGYTLSVEILAQSIQADGVDKLGNRPIELAWNVDIVDGEVKAATIVNPTQP